MPVRDLRDPVVFATTVGRFDKPVVDRTFDRSTGHSLGHALVKGEVGDAEATQVFHGAFEVGRRAGAVADVWSSRISQRLDRALYVSEGVVNGVTVAHGRDPLTALRAVAEVPGA